MAIIMAPLTRVTTRAAFGRARSTRSADGRRGPGHRSPAVRHPTSTVVPEWFVRRLLTVGLFASVSPVGIEDDELSADQFHLARADLAAFTSVFEGVRRALRQWGCGSRPPLRKACGGPEVQCAFTSIGVGRR